METVVAKWSIYWIKPEQLKFDQTKFFFENSLLVINSQTTYSNLQVKIVIAKTIIRQLSWAPNME